LFFSQYGFKLSNFFPTFVTSVLFLSQSDFKLSNKFWKKQIWNSKGFWSTRSVGKSGEF
jgi:hypothetical protein